MQDRNLRVRVLKVEVREARAQLLVGQGRLPVRRLGLQAEERVAHRAAALAAAAVAIAVAVAVAGTETDRGERLAGPQRRALARGAGDGAAHGGEDDARERDARGRAEEARVRRALHRDHADVGHELVQAVGLVLLAAPVGLDPRARLAAGAGRADGRRGDPAAGVSLARARAPGGAGPPAPAAAIPAAVPGGCPRG